jgi:hypothetical protein
MRRRLRPPIAAVLAVCMPGLGHLISRQFRRALVWHATIVAGGLALYSLYDVGPIDPTGSIGDLVAAVPADVAFPIALLVGLSAVDAYLVARASAAAAARAEAAAAAIREHTTAGDGPLLDGSVPADTEIPAHVACPHCGRAADVELDFCHWCTEPLPWANAA